MAMERLRMTIEGMSCGHCLNAVSNALNRVPGVRVEQVRIGAATVEFDPARTSADAILGVVNDEGYLAYRAA